MSIRHLSALVFFSLLPAATHAQTPPGPASAEDDRGWTTFGVGRALPHPFMGGATANFGRERVVQVGLHSSALLHVGVHALHVGAGLSRVNRWTRTAVTVGPAFVWGDETGDDDEFATAGVVLNGQALFTPIPEVGVGLDAFLNVNPIEPAVGVGIVFVFEANK